MSEHTQHTIRPAVPEDAHKVAQIARRGIPGYPFEEVYNPAQVKDQILSGEELRMIAEVPGMGVVATAMLGIGNMAEIKRVVVDPEARGVGIAKSIVKNLAEQAVGKGQVAWSDVRADQIGMQRAALNAGMKAVSLEQGKHVVYHHRSPEGDLGPARETMIHMSSLNLDEWDLHRQLKFWPQNLVHKLVENMMKSHWTKQKDFAWSSFVLPDPKKVRDEVTSAIDKFDAIMDRKIINNDIESLVIEDMNVVVIKPDSSAFIMSRPNGGIGVVASQLIQTLGLHIVTCYSPVNQDVAQLSRGGMEPAMVRPWQENKDKPPEWQIGWRATSPAFNDILHPVNLDPAIKQQLLEFQQGIINNGTIKSHIETIL